MAVFPGITACSAPPARKEKEGKSWQVAILSVNLRIYILTTYTLTTMAQNYKNIKIFISSTFCDMDAERDAIMNRVYPAVAQALAPKHIHVDFIDLRWGVSTQQIAENERENHVLRECIDSINESRPFFIGLLGDRYGWVPSQESWDCIIDGMSDHEKQFINQDTAEARSVTELEMLFGSLIDSDNLHRSLFCFRNPAVYEHMDKEHLFIYIQDDENAQSHLARLKKHIIETMSSHQLKRNVCQYDCQWDGNRLCGMDGLVDFLTQAIVQEIELYECESEEGNPENEYDSTAARFDAIMDHHDANFCGREDFVANLTDVAATTQAKAIMLTSHYGLGKTALLSHWYRQLCKDDRFLPYIYFADRQGNHGKVEMPLKYWLADERTGATQRFGAESQYDLGLLANKLEEATAADSRRKLLIIDDIHLLDNYHKWFDPRLFADDTLIICTADSEQAPRFEHLCDNIYLLPPLSTDTARQLVETRLQRVGKQLQPAVMETLLSKQEGKVKPAGIPLWSVMMTRQLVLLDGNYFAQQRKRQEEDAELKIQNSLIDIIAQAPIYPEQLFMTCVESAATFVDRQFVLDVLRFIAITEFGIRPQDLKALMGEKWDNLKFAELKRHMGSLLAIDEESGTIDFAYSNFRSEIYIQAGEQLAPYFAALITHLGDISKNEIDNNIIGNEIPYLAVKYTTAAVMDYILDNDRGHLRDKSIYALADLTFRKSQVVKAWMELAAERKPKETIALATQIIRTHMGCRHYTAAATVASWVIPKIDSGKLDQEARRDYYTLVVLYMESLYQTGQYENAAHLSNHLLSECYNELDNPDYYEICGMAILVKTRIESKNPNEHTLGWAAKGNDLMDRLVLEMQQVQMITYLRELSEIYLTIPGVNEPEAENRAQFVDDYLSAPQWMYHLYFMIAPLRKHAEMLEQHDDFAAAILRQQADDYEQTLLNAYPDNPLFNGNCTIPCEQDGHEPDSFSRNFPESLSHYYSQKNPSIEDTLKLQIAFYRMCSHTEWKLKESKSHGYNEQELHELQRLRLDLRYMQATGVSSPLVMMGYSLANSCMAYYYEQMGDKQNMMYHNKQHEYALCEAYCLYPNIAELKRRYAAAIDETGRLFLMLYDNFKAGEKCYAKANEMFAQLFEQSQEGTLVDDMALSTYNLTTIYLMQKDYNKVCDTSARLLSIPQIESRIGQQDFLAGIYENLSMAKLAMGDSTAAKEYQLAAKGIYKRLLEEHPDNEKYMRDVAISCIRQTELLMSIGGKVDDAIAEINEGEDMLQRVLTLIPNSPKAINNYIGLLSCKTKLYIRLHNSDRMIEAYDKFEALTLRNIIETRNPQHIPLMLSEMESFVVTAQQSKWEEMAHAFMEVKQQALKHLVENRLIKPQ